MCDWKRKSEFIEFIGNTVTVECDGGPIGWVRIRPGRCDPNGPVFIRAAGCYFYLPPWVVVQTLMVIG